MADMPSQPGVSDEQIAAWEHKQGLRLPDVLREALRRQNGGFVGDEQNGLIIQQLDRIVPMEEDVWEWVWCDEDDAPDQRLILELGHNDLGGVLYLDYNECGPQGEPAVVLYYSDPGDYEPCATSLAEFFEEMLDTDDAPQIDWSETEGLPALARETVDLSRIYGGTASLEQILVQTADALCLYQRDTTDSRERLTRMLLPLPLDAEWASVSPLRPGSPGTFALHLQPKELDGIVHVESRRTHDGRWKNCTQHGVPIYEQFESTDRVLLEELRNTLFGETAAKRRRRQDETEQRLQARMEALSPEQQQAAALQMVLQMQGELDQEMREQLEELDEPPPPELAEAARVLQEKLAQATAQAQDILSRTPLDPEMAELIDELARGVDDQDED
jgi:hypothetical protein